MVYILVGLVCEIRLLVVNIIIIRSVAILLSEERLSVPKVSCHERQSAAGTYATAVGGGMDRSHSQLRRLQPDPGGLEKLRTPVVAQDVERIHAYVRADAV